ncbi:hypothetical protein ANCDUO_02869 [Ancylostoma duodenale]|uniref:Protein kinase domain-containing protein n=1 Tax=Ancylostoma duodenale TaxID=51022 RepID=A0A0C2DAP3_9BILA|nr:hypothetical protein ANCDUO_02869 [Ancylostoma duodenale]
MELCELGSMRSYVKKNGPLSDRAAAYVLRQIISAVKYMHREGILHRDLSSGNVLISRIFSPEKISVKLCDFGLATHLRKGETACTVVGTPGYIAPQVFKQEYDQAADVYSLGGVLYTMLTGNDPPSKGPMRFDGLGLSAVELIESMMEQDAAKRIPLNVSWWIIAIMLLFHEIGQQWVIELHFDHKNVVGHENFQENGALTMTGHTNSRGDEPRPRRATSNPPTLSGRVRLTTGGAADSGFGSRSCGERRNMGWSGSHNHPHTTAARDSRASGEPPWPLPIHRCGGTRLVTAAGRVIFDKPLHLNVKRPLEHDPLIPMTRERDTAPLTR